MDSFIKLANNYWAKKIDEKYFVFHSLNGEPFVVTEDIFMQLNKPDIEQKLKNELEDVLYFTDNRLYELNKVKSEIFLKNYNGPIVLDLIVSEQCNLSCHMCSHSQTTSNSINHVNKFLDFETARSWIDYYVDFYSKKRNLNIFSFHYGAAEPLTNKNIFIKILEYVSEKTKNKNLEVEQLVNTNLTLLDDEITQALVKHKVKVSVGLDGLKPQNDLIRITKTGKGTFDVIKRNIEFLISKGVSVGVALTLTERNFNEISPMEFLSEIKSIGVKTVLVDSDFIHRINFSAKSIVTKLLEFYKIGDDLSIEIIGSWRTPFANLTTENDTEPTSFCTSLLGKNLTVTPSNNLTFCTYSGLKMTHFDINDIDDAVARFTDEVKKLMSKRLPTQNEFCKGCVIEGHCNGGCYLTYEVTNKSDTLCDIYIEATSELIKYKLLKGELI